MKYLKYFEGMYVSPTDEEQLKRFKYRIGDHFEYKNYTYFGKDGILKIIRIYNIPPTSRPTYECEIISSSDFSYIGETVDSFENELESLRKLEPHEITALKYNL